MPARVVLCIDDSDSGLKIRKLLLESKGFRVLTARDGATGLKIVDQQRVDAVVLDYYMPSMDGEEVAKQIRKRHPQIPILLLSGFQGLIPNSLFLMVDGFIQKGEPAALLLAELERLTGAERNSSDEQARRA